MSYRDKIDSQKSLLNVQLGYVKQKVVVFTEQHQFSTKQ